SDPHQGNRGDVESKCLVCKCHGTSSFPFSYRAGDRSEIPGMLLRFQDGPPARWNAMPWPVILRTLLLLILSLVRQFGRRWKCHEKRARTRQTLFISFLVAGAVLAAPASYCCSGSAAAGEGVRDSRNAFVCFFLSWR